MTLISKGLPLFLPRNKYSPLSTLSFDAIYCINLERKPERKAYAEEQFKSINLPNVTFFKAFDGLHSKLRSRSGRLSPGMIGCYMTHQLIWREAIERGYERILVFEDDIRFVDGFNQHLLACLPTMPTDWELIWWGYTERPIDSANNSGRVRSYVNDWWAIPNDTWGTHAYSLQGKHTIKKFYEGSLNMNEQIDIHISRHIIPYYKIKAYSTWPKLVRQNKQFTSDCQFKP